MGVAEDSEELAFHLVRSLVIQQGAITQGPRRSPLRIGEDDTESKKHLLDT